MTRWTKILCAVDLEETTHTAVEHAASLARQLDAELTLVHVFTPVRWAGEGVPLAVPVITAAEEAELRGKVDAARAEAERLSGRQVRTVVCGGSPAHEVPRIAEREHANLVVVGTRGRKGFGRAILGSVAGAIVRHAPCAVLVARPGNQGD
jgi:nucleotide-binding universal stress UspA family protein